MSNPNWGKNHNFDSWKAGVRRAGLRRRDGSGLYRRPVRNAGQQRFRKAVFERDDYTCQSCGQRGGRLEAHHYPVTFKELVTKIGAKNSYEAEDCDELWSSDNGRTLCKHCHLKETAKARRKVNPGELVCGFEQSFEVLKQPVSSPSQSTSYN